MLMAAMNKPQEESKRIFKDIGDTSLFICGYFSDSISNKIVDRSYYANLGVTAYKRLNISVPKVLDIPSFYDVLATSFDSLTEIIALVAKEDQSDPHKHFIFKSLTDKAS
jgi:hypothetical protein